MARQRVFFLGGPGGDGVYMEIPASLELPPYICSGDVEPYAHFEQITDGSPTYLYVGICADIPHELGYPHSHTC